MATGGHGGGADGGGRGRNLKSGVNEKSDT